MSLWGMMCVSLAEDKSWRGAQLPTITGQHSQQLEEWVPWLWKRDMHTLQRDLGLIPGLGRSSGEEKGYPLRYSGLENFMDCIVSRTKSAHMESHKVKHDWVTVTFTFTNQHPLQPHSVMDSLSNHTWRSSWEWPEAMSRMSLSGCIVLFGLGGVLLLELGSPFRYQLTLMPRPQALWRQVYISSYPQNLAQFMAQWIFADWIFSSKDSHPNALISCITLDDGKYIESDPGGVRGRNELELRLKEWVRVSQSRVGLGCFPSLWR